MFLVVLFILYFPQTVEMVSVVGSRVKWPSGSYGLPRPINGCPEYWREGLRYQDTEDVHSHNKHSTSYHLSGSVNDHGIRQEFCIKDDNMFEVDNTKWPDGQYCIYKYGDKCPNGLIEGWVFWDDENQEEIDGGNMVAGYVPEGVYELDTLMYFCCNNKGNKSVPIDLPLTKPFYLLAFNGKECQSVKGATSTSEFIKWDDEDRGNTNSHSAVVPFGVKLDAFDTEMYYCYYDTGICGKFGTICQNVTIDESGLEGKSALTDDNNNKQTFQESLFNNIIRPKASSSARAVGIGCGVAGVIVCSALAGLGIRHFLNKKKEENERIEHYLSEEEIFPLPDHGW